MGHAGSCAWHSIHPRGHTRSHRCENSNLYLLQQTGFARFDRVPVRVPLATVHQLPTLPKRRMHSTLTNHPRETSLNLNLSYCSAYFYDALASSSYMICSPMRDIAFKWSHFAVFKFLLCIYWILPVFTLIFNAYLSEFFEKLIKFGMATLEKRNLTSFYVMWTGVAWAWLKSAYILILSWIIHPKSYSFGNLSNSFILIFSFALPP